MSERFHADAVPVAMIGAVIVGLELGERAGTPIANVSFAIGAAALAAGWVTRSHGRAAIVACGVLLLGVAVMGRALDGQAHSPLRGAIERADEVTLRGVATDDPVGPTYAADVLMRVDSGSGTHRTILVRAAPKETATLRIVEAGDHLVVRGRLAFLGRGPYDDRARRRHAVGALDGAQVVALSSPTGLLAVADRVRGVILRGTAPLRPGTRALVAGFLLGDTRGVPNSVVAAYRDSGLSHLLAVSGVTVH